MINVLKETGITLRTHGKESNPLFLKNLQYLSNESSIFRWGNYRTVKMMG